jgi:ankyrin repeat protein
MAFHPDRAALNGAPYSSKIAQRTEKTNMNIPAIISIGSLIVVVAVVIISAIQSDRKEKREKSIPAREPQTASNASGAAASGRLNVFSGRSPRGGGDLVDNHDGTMTDHSSMLMWQMSDDGIERTHQDAVAYCVRLRLAGHSDWRLPSVREFNISGFEKREAADELASIISSSRNHWAADGGPESDLAYVGDGATMYRTNHHLVRAVRSCPKPSAAAESSRPKQLAEAAPPRPDRPSQSEAFFIAVKEGNEAAAEALLNTDPGLVASKDENGRTALHYVFKAALRDTHLAVATLLLDHGADVNAKDKWGETPLLEAVEHWNSGDYLYLLLKLLLSRGADVDSLNSLGSTPLHRVAVLGKAEAAKILVAAGANVNAKNNEGATPVNYAAEKRPDVLKVLLAQGGQASIEALILAARHGHLESVRDLLERGAEVNSTSGGYSPLRWAACGWSDDHVKIAELLLAHGADAHVRDRDGKTPLAYAQHNNQLPAMIALLQRQMT